MEFILNTLCDGIGIRLMFLLFFFFFFQAKEGIPCSPFFRGAGDLLKKQCLMGGGGGEHTPTTKTRVGVHRLLNGPMCSSCLAEPGIFDPHIVSGMPPKIQPNRSSRKSDGCCSGASDVCFDYVSDMGSQYLNTVAILLKRMVQAGKRVVS